jgi:hypothetical protein
VKPEDDRSGMTAGLGARMTRRRTVWLAVASVAISGCSSTNGGQPASGSTSSSASTTPSKDGTAVGPGCTTTGRLVCDPSAARPIAPAPAVASVAASGPIPEAFGGIVTPGSYVLTGVTLYGSAPPDIAFTGVGTQQTAALTVSCDQYNEVFGSTSSNGSGSGNTCGRLVPTERPLAAVLQSNDPTVDGTPYNATAATLDLILIQPYASGVYLLGEYAVVDHFTLVGSAGAPPADGADASTPPPGGNRDPRCPSTPPANGASCVRASAPSSANTAATPTGDVRRSRPAP